MRKHPTPAEAALWEMIRAGKLGGRFRRQAPMLGYIADFYCPSWRLVVELDGAAHDGRGTYDARRNAAMRAAGYKVLRFRNAEVFRRPEAVLASIKSAAPHPTLSKPGDD